MGEMLWGPMAWRELDHAAQLVRFDEVASRSHVVAAGGARVVLADEPFDSRHFGMRMAKLACAWGAMDEAPALVVTAVDHAQVGGIDHLSCRVPSERPGLVQAFEGAGFRFVDSSVELGRLVPLLPDGSMEPEVGLLRESDRPGIIALSRSAFDRSRYSADPCLSAEARMALTESWVNNDLNGRADVVLVARDEQGPTGFAAVILDGARRSATIDLVAVAARARRRGVGGALLRSVLTAVSGRAELLLVGTQGSNYAALRLYQRAGFAVRHMDITLHMQLAR